MIALKEALGQIASAAQTQRSDMGTGTEEGKKPAESAGMPTMEMDCTETLPTGGVCSGVVRVYQKTCPSKGSSYQYVEPCGVCEREWRIHRCFGLLSPNKGEALSLKDALLGTLATKPERTEDNADAMGVLRAIMSRPGEKRSAILLGPVGTGKTFLALHTLMSLVERSGRSCLYVQEQALLDGWRVSHSNEAGRRDWGLGLFRRAKAVDYLLIDDFGQARNVSERALDAIEGLIMSRYESCLPVIATSNMKPGQLEAARGQRVWSRLCGMARGNIVEVCGHDWRKQVGTG